jgi:hypothetical protein
VSVLRAGCAVAMGFLSYAVGAQIPAKIRSPFPFDPSALVYPEWAQERDQARLNRCNAFLHDLKSGADVHIVEPIGRAQDLDALEKSRWFGRCGASDFAKFVEFEGRIWDSVKDLPRAEREKYGRTFKMAGPFMLYRIDIDRNPKNGQELLFYGAGASDSRGTRADSSGFAVLDLNKCEPKYWAQAIDSANYPENAAGMVMHKGTPLLFDARYFKKEASYSLRFQELTYVPRRKGFIFGGICTFSAKDVKPNPLSQPTGEKLPAAEQGR